MQLLRIILLFTVIATSLSTLGCSSGGGKNIKTSESITSTASRLGVGRAQIDQVVASLNKITAATPTQDLRPLLKEYSSNVDKLDSIAQSVRKQADEMRQRGQTYFREWEAEVAKIHNEDIKTQSAQRRQEVEQSFARINQSSQELRDAYRPLMSDLQDIRTALNADLTPRGVTSIRPIAERVARQATATKNAAGPVEAEFKALGIELSPSGG